MRSTAQIKKLQETSTKHKEALQEDISFAVEQTKKVALRVILLGGGLALALVIARSFLVKKSTSNTPAHERKGKSSRWTQLRNFILAELTAFLLTLAKEKLIEYLQEIDTTHVDTERTEREKS